MESGFSTAISDGLLALVTLHTAYSVCSKSFLACLGFLIIAAAAGLGAACFGLQSPVDKLITWHQYMTWLSSVAGLPLISCGYCLLTNSTSLSNALLSACFSVLLLRRELTGEVLVICRDIMGALALLVLLIVSMVGGNSYGILGFIFYVIGSLATKMNLNVGLKAVDIFHYALILGNIALMFGLTKEETPVFYRGT